MDNCQEIMHKKNTQSRDTHGLRFATPLRKAFKRLQVVRKKPTSGIATPFVDCSNTRIIATGAFKAEEMALDGGLTPPPAPKSSRLAAPAAPPSPASPLPLSVSRSGNLLTIRSNEIGISESPSLVQALVMSDDAGPESSSPMAPLPRGDLFQLGLTPVQSMRSIVDAECPVFAPTLPTVQRVSNLNIARSTADMMDIVNMDLDNTRKVVISTPPSRNTSKQWLPNLVSMRKGSPRNISTTAVFEGGHLAERRHSTFISKLVGSTWGFAGLGFAPMGGHHRTPSAAIHMPTQETKSEVMGSLPSIPTGKCSIERAVFGSGIVATTSKISVSKRELLVNGLVPANSTLRMTGSKSARALEHLEFENRNVAPGVKIEERPRKKRRSVAESFMYSAAPSPSPVRVTRAMAARQAEIETNTPTRITRSASKKLAESTNSPCGRSNAARSKNVKRM